MFESILQTIRHAYSGEVAKRHIACLSQHHRIQASPGYREAAHYVQRQLHAAGVCNELLSFPADHATHFWTMESFQEWACAKATLDVMHDGHRVERLCDFQAVPISIIQRSAPVDGTFDIVVLDDGTEEAHYRDLDVAGKIVLTDGDLRRVVDLAVRRRGAAGILFDGMSQTAPGRSPLDLPDARQYTSFWWGKNDAKCFGFVLTPRQGREMRSNPPARVRAHVVSTFCDGAFEVVTAFIPGETDQEVVVLSHLCHPQPSANDNASGAAATIEIAATLHELISDGLLPPPKHGIRFLWMPEMTGTFAYLSTFEDRLPRMIAGVNLDMVGQDQDRCHSTFNIEQPPEAMASFAPVLLARLWDGLMLLEADSSQSSLSGAVRHAVTPFSGGSDHTILCDPTVGVPTPMLIQWPDRFYHTSEDTLDKVDPTMLARIGSLAAGYAYAVACAGENEATWLGHEIVALHTCRLTQHAQNAINDVLATDDAEAIGRLAAEMRQAASYRVDRDKAALESLLRLWPGASELTSELGQHLDEAFRREQGRVEAVCRQRARALGVDDLPQPANSNDDPWQQLAGHLIPQRLYRGPMAFLSIVDEGPPEERDALWDAGRKSGRDWFTARTLAEYWIDGQRTIAEIADLIQHETGKFYGPEILAYCKFLVSKGLLALQSESLE
jgi:aminopeptidase YwaD